MNPMVQQILTQLVRYTMVSVFAGFIQKGVLSSEQAEYVVVGVAGLMATVVWGVWVKYKDRLKLNTALASPAGTTEREAERMMKGGSAPPATLSKDDSPYLNTSAKVKEG